MFVGVNELYNEIDKLRSNLDLQHRKYERELGELKRKCDIMQLIQENDRRNMFCMPAGFRMPTLEPRHLYDDCQVVDKPFPGAVTDSAASSLHSAQFSPRYSVPSSATAATSIDAQSATVATPVPGHSATDLPSPPSHSTPAPLPLTAPAPVVPPPPAPPVVHSHIPSYSQDQGKASYETIPKYRLAKVHTVAEIWREFNYGTSVNPSLRDLEKKFGSSWRYPTEMRTYARRKAIFTAIEFGIKKGIPELQVIQDLEKRREYVTDTGAKKKRPLVWLSSNIPSMYVHRFPTANLRL
ncbi:hypothetical protein CLIB1423_21S01882 [[Candida] railenensis]|uniref:Transcription activator GCR1-like domain-containing protein n=1 Tax=[Candida] railenensis TaxID=45579 RepID=A0A9P0W0Z6_9ASCO|nr:hypothetical protein CLIB1423_21S01882 [[Candida] railenensis]